MWMDVKPLGCYFHDVFEWVSERDILKRILEKKSWVNINMMCLFSLHIQQRNFDKLLIMRRVLKIHLILHNNSSFFPLSYCVFVYTYVSIYSQYIEEKNYAFFASLKTKKKRKQRSDINFFPLSLSVYFVAFKKF